MVQRLPLHLFSLEREVNVEPRSHFVTFSSSVSDICVKMLVSALTIVVYSQCDVDYLRPCISSLSFFRSFDCCASDISPASLPLINIHTVVVDQSALAGMDCVQCLAFIVRTLFCFVYSETSSLWGDSVK